METLATVQQEIIRVIKKFRFEELESSVMPIFPEISWNDVRCKLVKQHKNFTSVNAALLLKVFINESNLGITNLKNRLTALRLIDIGWHSNKRIWYGYTLICHSSAKYYLSRQIKNNMQDYFNELNININVKVYTHNNITYVSLVEERKRKKAIIFYLALFMGQKYFFSTLKRIPSDILDVIVKSVNSKNCKVKRFDLSGRDLKSLSELCWKKKEKALDPESVTKILQFKETSPEKKPTGINFTQQKQRRAYAKECFGDNSPILEVLAVQGPSLPLYHEEMAEKLPDQTLHVKWKYHSKNIATCLSQVIERRILLTPVPEYISNLIISGKNEFTLKEC
ncbi:uncharacterized protein LOC143427988 [Xylocopa sonorina]|uniref:uncharacterized protein LOC143427988 n=1 Tax=Xylocopa sonorina TaxID=1818115 RepID=UPI00403B0AC0